MHDRTDRDARAEIPSIVVDCDRSFRAPPSASSLRPDGDAPRSVGRYVRAARFGADRAARYLTMVFFTVRAHHYFGRVYRRSPSGECCGGTSTYLAGGGASLSAGAHATFQAFIHNTIQTKGNLIAMPIDNYGCVTQFGVVFRNSNSQQVVSAGGCGCGLWVAVRVAVRVAMRVAVRERCIARAAAAARLYILTS